MKAGWIGQMAGVGWGGPTEFKWRGEIIPEEKMPKWKPERINQFEQDDIYVEMTFLRTLELYGLDASIRQAGIDFANSGYMLWHANKYGRDNLREGIAPPDSGHPKFSDHADDIDYQIEADYAGLISPGMSNMAIELGEIFGRLMNYGDGLYGGQFVAGMYAEAFFEDDIEKIVRAGLACIPEGSQYHECITDVLNWYSQNPDDWEKTWQLIEDKYQNNPDYRKFSCDKGKFNIDAKINGAYIVMGLLYGEGDLDKTIIISTRCGQDSDCNPSNAAGVLFTTIGFEKLPEKFTSALDPEGKFSHTPYNFPLLVHVCESLSRAAIIRAGGRVERDDEGVETFVIPVEEPKPSALEQCWEPGPIANSRFTEAELLHIDPPPMEEEEEKYADVQDLNEAVGKIASGWKVKGCSGTEFFGLHNEFAERENVLITNPESKDTPCTLFKRVKIPSGKTQLQLTVGHIKELDWMLIVKANGDELLNTIVGSDTSEDGWWDITVDLSAYADSEIMLELLNASNDWNYEIALWTKIQIDSN
ncbi:MAG: ADP-ribosylglycohydrolase family protein [Planctomycetota bacterium]